MVLWPMPQNLRKKQKKKKTSKFSNKPDGLIFNSILCQLAYLTYYIMAKDTNKKLAVGAELDTEKVTQSINNFSKIINALLAQQKKLDVAGKQNTATFDGISSALKILQKNLQDANLQLIANTTATNNLGTANKNLGTTLASATTQHQKHAKAASDNAAKTKELSGQINELGRSLKTQKPDADSGKSALDGYAGSIKDNDDVVKQLQGSITQTNELLGTQTETAGKSKDTFDAHKITMDHLKTSFDEIKDVSGIFGPSLQDAAKGFNVMKSGLTLVEDGFKGVGTAIKADGFEFLLNVLQMMFDYFVKSSKGSKILHGAISAIGVIVNKITGLFHSFMDVIIDAFSHPVETLKKLGKMIVENLINRFTAFGKILDGLIHLDFKKIGDGALQAVTGVTDATDKMKSAFNTLKNGVIETAGEIVDAFQKGYDKTDKALEKSLDNRIKHYKKYKDRLAQRNTEPLEGRSAGLPPDNSSSASAGGMIITDYTIPQTQAVANKEVTIKKTALQQIEDFAKKSGGKIATDALTALSKSIQAQSDAKIKGLEADKANELNNKNLTAAQKAAIEDKYKKKEAAVKLKAFKAEQKASIAQAIINGALAVTKVEAQTGILGALAIPAIIAQTAIQVATIAKQKPPAMAKGGYFRSDGRGAVIPGYSRTDNTNAYLRSGEAVVVSEAMRDPWARNLVSAINVAYGGRDFSIPNLSRGYAIGGIFTDGGNANRYYNQPVNDQKNLANTVAYQMINNFPPIYVDVKDVNNQQNILAQTVNRVNL